MVGKQRLSYAISEKRILSCLLIPAMQTSLKHSFRHTRKVGPETRDFWLDPRPTHFISESFDPKHETLKVGPETRDSFYT